MKVSSKGFTLVELLVVISIISMLASIVIASTATVQAQARDAKRTQVGRQIDLAVRLYMENNNGNAPDLGGCAALQSGNPDITTASACFAVSTAAVGTPNGDAWVAFKNQIAPYMSNVPNDPCPLCSTISPYPLGYTYVSPLAMQYFCNPSPIGSCSQSPNQLNRSYQVYSSHEKQQSPTGFTALPPFFTFFYAPPTVTSMPSSMDRGNNYVVWGTNFNPFANGNYNVITFTSVNQPSLQYQFAPSGGVSNGFNFTLGTIPLDSYTVTVTTPGGVSNSSPVSVVH